PGRRSPLPGVATAGMLVGRHARTSSGSWSLAWRRGLLAQSTSATSLSHKPRDHPIACQGPSTRFPFFAERTPPLQRVLTSATWGAEPAAAKAREGLSGIGFLAGQPLTHGCGGPPRAASSGCTTAPPAATLRPPPPPPFGLS